MKTRKIIFIFLSSLCLVFPMKAQEDTICKTNTYTWLSTKMVEGTFSGTAVSPTRITSTYSSPSTKDDNHQYTWRKKNDLSRYPAYSSPNLIEEAIYNMGLDEMVNAIESDSTLRTGASWGGVWTRDVSYSIYLAMSYMQKTASKNSLLKKTDRGRIIQDTGTGGSWPVSTDRIVWAMAAWEYYKVYGDQDWLTRVYPIIKQSVDDDYFNVLDEETGLIMGESSFLDWREQSYPLWMQPADISQSKCLGTNAVHYEALVVLSKMAEILGKGAEKEIYAEKAVALKQAINEHLWMPEKGYYAQYMYGRSHQIISPRSETLGEALCILFDIASPEQQVQIINNMPVGSYGPSVFYPYIPDLFSYHNNAVWPFVTSYWMLAAAKVGNEEVVKNAIGSTYRAAAMFATNKENFTAKTGDWTGTDTNSDNMLWSLSGNIGIVHRVYFGMSYEKDKLVFNPFIPRILAGTRTLNGVKYRNTILNMEISGYGDRISSFLLDEVESAPEVAETLTGEHDIKIVMSNSFQKETQPINMIQVEFSLKTPLAHMNGTKLSWSSVPGATGYEIVRDGEKIKKQTETSYDALLEGEYQVIAVCENELLSSFASEPIIKHPQSVNIIELGGLVLGKNEIKNADGQIISGPTYTTNITADEAGMYDLDWLYSNGNGTVYGENKCALRTLYIDDNKSGIFVFPQRGNNLWAAKGWSNSVHIYLTKGSHQLDLKFMTENANMNWDVNDAVIHKLRIISQGDKDLPDEKEYNLFSVSGSDGIGKRIVNIHSTSGYNNNTENVYKLLIGAEKVTGYGDKWYSDNTEKSWVIFSLTDFYNIDKIEWRDCNWYEIKEGTINSDEYWLYASKTGVADGDWIEIAHEQGAIDQNTKSKIFEAPVEARYIKFVVKGGGSETKKIRIYGFDIFGDFSRKIDRGNLISVGKTIIGCSSYSSDRETPANLVDGLLTNYWGATKPITGSSWVIVDLEKEYEISKFAIRDSTPGILGYNMSVSKTNLAATDENWISVVSNTTFESTQELKESTLSQPVKARYVKFEIPRNKQGTLARIKEFEIYGTDVSSGTKTLSKDKSDFYLYPNPVTKKEGVRSSLSGKMKIFTLEGALVQENLVKENEVISLASLNQKNYLVQLTDKSGARHYTKLIVK